MKIAILGYGKMGKIIDKLATASGHEIVLKAGKDTELSIQSLSKAEVAIEFSRPEAAYNNISFCIKSGIPVVSGTTGWLDKMDTIHQLCIDHNGAFFYASNFSIGVYMFSVINQQLARMMNHHNQYDVNMEEIHHTQKLDAPSGTAISLAQGILTNLERKETWVNSSSNKSEDLSIQSKRIDKVPGTHIIQWDSAIDTIKIEHIAHSREGFARGAITAAQWLVGKEGCFGMKDLIGF